MFTHHVVFRAFIADDYNHTVNGCEPATQTVRVDFAYDPQDGLCFGGIELHKSVK